MSTARAIGLLLGAVADSVVNDRRSGALGRVAAAARPLRTAPAAALGAALVAGVAVERLGRRHRALQVAGTALATWSALGGAALAAQGAALARALDASDLDTARATLPMLAEHDRVLAPDLDTAALSRAAVESVAEKTCGALVAPLLWGAVAGVPGLLGYRAVQALAAAHNSGDGAGAGWVAARLEEATNLVPSRAAAALTVACAPVVGGSAHDAWQVWRRDGSAHPRPNHGQVEAAFAGALQVRLGGRAPNPHGAPPPHGARYPHGAHPRPVLGHGRTPDAGDLTRGVELSRVVGAVTALVAAVLAVVVGRR